MRPMAVGPTLAVTAVAAGAVTASEAVLGACTDAVGAPWGTAAKQHNVRCKQIRTCIYLINYT